MYDISYPLYIIRLPLEHPLYPHPTTRYTMVRHFYTFVHPSHTILHPTYTIIELYTLIVHPLLGLVKGPVMDTGLPR